MGHFPCHAIGLMSGTSLDGVDAALLETDGEFRVRPGLALTVPYNVGRRAEIRSLLAQPNASHDAHKVADGLTDDHARAVSLLLDKAGLTPRDIDVIGFHGQTILHRPAQRLTYQIGDGQRLANQTGIPVVYDFRTADVQAGGQGAPLVPIYHQARFAAGRGSQAVLNIGGVANVTFMADNHPLVACDVGPGNALIDDWVLSRTGQSMDKGGALARQGSVHNACLQRALSHPWFYTPPPKSLDRNDFAFLFDDLATCSTADGAATLAAFTVAAVQKAVTWMPVPPRSWVVCGGGRHNTVLMEGLRQAFGAVDPIEALGGNGDFIEAEAFAFLAVRHMRGLPQTFPETTGCPHPLPGGKLVRPQQ